MPLLFGFRLHLGASPMEEKVLICVNVFSSGLVLWGLFGVFFLRKSVSAVQDLYPQFQPVTINSTVTPVCLFGPRCPVPQHKTIAFLAF